MYVEISGSKLVFGIVLLCAILQASCSDGHATAGLSKESYLYKSSDGIYMEFVISDRVFLMYGSENELTNKSDIGGPLKDCSDVRFRCLLVNSVPLMVPIDGVDRNSWTREGVRFVVTSSGEANNGENVVEVTQAGSLLARYAFGNNRGLLWVEFTRNDGSGEVFGPFLVQGDALWARD